MDSKVEKFPFKPLGANIKNEFQSGFRQAFAKPENITKKHEENDNNKTPEDLPIVKAYTEQDLSEAKSKGYEEGYAKGYSNAKAKSDELNKKIDDTITLIDQGITKILAEKRIEIARQEKAVTKAIVSIAKKISGRALKNEPVEEVGRVVEKSFKLLFDEPVIIIYVNHAIVDEITNRVNKIVQRDHFKGEVEIKGREDITSGSCDIQWQGGGVKSNKDDIWEEVDRLYEELL